MNLPAGVFFPVVRLFEDVFQPLVGFGGDNLVEGLNLGLGTHELGEKTAVLGPGVAEHAERGALFPANKLPAHDELRTVGIYQTFLIQHVDGILGVVQDDDGLAEHSDIGDTAWRDDTFVRWYKP